MKKTACVFNYDHENEIVLNELKKECEWILTNDAVATLKLDGSACLYKEEILWKRYDRKLLPKYSNKFKAGDKPELIFFRTPPEGFVPCEETYDPNTFHWPGWVPVSKNDKYHLEAFENCKDELVDGATYELMGPAVAKNTAGLNKHLLIRHGSIELDVPDRSYEGIEKFLTENYIEGIVFHHKKDGRLAKITRKHFNLFWKEIDHRKNKHKVK